MKGKKNVVLVPPMFGTVRFITKFEDFADEDSPYMYHCHMLSHEDEGMMGQFIVIDNATSVEEQGKENISVYPNPVSHTITMEGLNSSTILLYNSTGQLLIKRKSLNSIEKFDMSKYASGIYYFKVTSSNMIKFIKLVKK